MSCGGRLPALSLAVVGARHPNADGSNRRFFLALCEPGDEVVLKPEPKNAHDPLAIAVYTPLGGQLGYISAERAPRVGQLMRQGRNPKALFQAQAPWGAWIRVAFDGEAPVLPALRETLAVDEIDFWPDPEWGDD